jgi:hypothetical protein
LSLRIAFGKIHKNANQRHRLLRARGKRPCRRRATTQNAEKFPPPHARLQAQNAASYRLKAGLWKGPSLLQHEMPADVGYGSIV